MTNLAVASTSDSALTRQESRNISYMHGAPYIEWPAERVAPLAILSVNTAEEDTEETLTAGAEEVWRLYGRINDEFVIVHPLRVTLSWTPTGLVAEQEELNMFAFGDGRIDALVNLAERIIEDYNLVVSRGHKLSPRMERHRDLLLKALSVNNGG